MSDEPKRPATRLAKGGRRKEWRGKLVNVPVERTSTVLFDSVAELESGRGDPAEHDGRAPGLAHTQRKAWDELGVVVHLFQAAHLDSFGTERADGLRNVLQVLGAPCRSYYDRFQPARSLGGCRAGNAERRRDRCSQSQGISPWCLALGIGHATLPLLFRGY